MMCCVTYYEREEGPRELERTFTPWRHGFMPHIRAFPLKTQRKGSHGFRKKKIKILQKFKSVSWKFSAVNPSRHCSTCLTIRGGLRLVRINFFFNIKVKREKKNIKVMKKWEIHRVSLMEMILRNGPIVKSNLNGPTNGFMATFTWTSRDAAWFIPFCVILSPAHLLSGLLLLRCFVIFFFFWLKFVFWYFHRYRFDSMVTELYYQYFLCLSKLFSLVLLSIPILCMKIHVNK